MAFLHEAMVPFVCEDYALVRCECLLICTLEISFLTYVAL